MLWCTPIKKAQMALPPEELYPPEECVELSKFGVGPFPSGLPVICPPHLPASGYGGTLFPPFEIEGGYGGYIYGIGPYGGMGLSRIPIQVDGGYGGYPYGLGPYGGVSLPPPPLPAISDGYGGLSYGYSCYGVCRYLAPYITSAISLNGTQIEIFFSEQMEADAKLIDPSSYTITGILGAAPANSISVDLGIPGLVGFTSVILNHSGTTIGGVYELLIVGPTNITGDPIEGSGRNTTILLTKGQVPTYSVGIESDQSLLLDFSEGLVEETVFPGIDNPLSYGISTSYPVPINIDSVEHPYLLDASKLLLNITGMTETEYACNVGPSKAIDYDATYLPDLATEFIGVELGTGTSLIQHDSLYLSNSFASYGWGFEDISGRIAPLRSFRVDFSFSTLFATFNPPLFDAVLGALHFNDGGVQFSVYLDRVTGTDVLTLVSGAFSSTVNANWSGGETLLSIVRNQLADTYTVLFNQTPLITVPTASLIGAPIIPEGAQFILSPNYETTRFRFLSLSITSTETIFSLAWNFLHHQVQNFIGASSQTKKTILTSKGPLVKGWGDATPATKEDIEVRVNSVSVEIEAVNPYNGEITTVIPIPLMPEGELSVDVDYKWFPVPVMEMVGLNTPGLVFNKYDVGGNRNSTTIFNEGAGGYDSSRFPFAAVLGPIDRRKPKYIGHRYLGFETEYTSSLNSPTTLLLNQNPHSISVDRFEEEVLPVSVSYEGEYLPPKATPVWALEGIDSGSLDVDEGTYTLIDATTGKYGVGFPAFYYRFEDLSFPSAINLGTRFIIDSYTPQGVFSGIGFGLHNNRTLFLVGALEINGVKHLGMLTNIAEPEKEESWSIGPKREIEIISDTSFTLPSDQTPISLESGDRFQILEGNQTGVYIIESITFQTECIDGGNVTTISLDPSTPFSPGWNSYGENDPDIYFEVLWLGTPFTYRLVAVPEEKSAELYIAGEISCLALEITGLPELAMPSQTCFQFSTEGEGQVFWGSLSRNATNESTWSFLRYGITPDQRFFQAHDILVSSEMNVLPEEDTGSEWFVVGGFGYSKLVQDERLLLKDLASDTSPELSFGYSRVEPFLDNHTNSDFDARFKVERQSLGYGDAVFRIRDGLREVLLATILYYEGPLTRQLLSLPSLSLPGIYLPSERGWLESTGNALSISSSDCTLSVSQDTGEEGTWESYLDLSSLPFSDEGSREFEAYFRVVSHSIKPSGIVGPIFGGDAGIGSPRRVALVLTQTGVALTGNGSSFYQEFPVTWDDGGFHSYKIIVNAVSSAVTFLFDDEVQLPVVDFSLFPNISSNPRTVFFGHTGTDTECVSDWRAISGLLRTENLGVMRTLGFYLGGNKSDIDSWALPRLDDDEYPNSDLSALVEEMDWTSELDVRIHRDVEWGVTLLRPDLILPPWHTGSFVTRITEYDAAWISVEYARLPRVSTTFGSLSWGALDPSSLTTQRWDYVRYRLYTHFNDDYRSPHHMILNQYNAIASGELLKDITPEYIEVVSLSSTLISLRPTHVNASLVFKIIEEDGTVHPFETWIFDQESQTVFLQTPLKGEQVPVTVAFSPGMPITNTYLEQQPVLDSGTLLNEGTPPVPKHQEADIISSVQFGSRINDPNDSLNIDPDFILNDPYRYVDFISEMDGLYEEMEFIEIDDGGQTGLISSICDTSFSGHGLLEMSLEGTYFSESNPSSLNKRTDDLIYPLTTFIMGGSHLTQSVIGNASLMSLWPSTPEMFGIDAGALNRQIQIVLRLNGTILVSPGVEVPLEEDLTISPEADNVPPSYSTDYDFVPDGVPGSGYGAALGVMEEFQPTTKIGPWGGLSSLEPASLLYGVSPEQPWGIPASGEGFVMNPPATASTLTILNLTI